MVCTTLNVHPHDGVPLPNVNVQHPIHGGVDFGIFTGIHDEQMVNHPLQVDVGKKLTFQSRGSELRFDAHGIEEACLLGIFDLDVDMGHTTPFGFIGGKAKHRTEGGNEEEDAENA